MVRRRGGRVDPAAARPARRGQAGPGAARDLARLHPHRRPHPQRHLGRQADVEPDAAAAAARRRPARPLRRRIALGDPRRHRQRSGSRPRLPARRCLPGGFVLAGGADPRLARQTRSDARLPRRVSRRRPSPTSSRCCASRRRAGARGSTRRTSSRSKCRIRCCGATSLKYVGTVLEALGQDPRLAPAPVLERQADQRSDEWVDRYRADAEREGCRHDDRHRLRHPARRRTAAARGRGGAHHPRSGRRTGTAGAAVLRGQGLHRAVAVGGEGFSAQPAALPGDARRHRTQLR